MHSPKGDVLGRMPEKRESRIMDYVSWFGGCVADDRLVGLPVTDSTRGRDTVPRVPTVNLCRDTVCRVPTTAARMDTAGCVPTTAARRDTACRVPARSTGVALKEEFIGAKVSGITGEGESVTKVSYFKGNDPSLWKSNISTYQLVNLGEIYEGIELKLKAHGNNVEKLLYVKPGADIEQIKIRLSGIQPAETPMMEGKQPPESPFIKGDCAESTFGKGEGRRPGGDVSTKSPLKKGARGLSVNEHGELEAETALGTVAFTRPVAYQEIDGKRVEVACGYTIAECVENLEFGFWNLDCFPYSAFRIQKPTHSDSQNPKSAIQIPKSEYGFTVASYDKTKDLIIDPLLASTYLGGSSSDYGQSLTLDTSGNVYVTGWTESTNFPTTSGAYDTSYNGGGDVFVSKLNSGLTSLLASTYLGGSSYDVGYSLALDTSGNVYVTGETASTDFPTTSGAYDTSYNGAIDVFVSKLNSGLTGLLASTYLGGSGDDGGYSLADGGSSLTLDPSGNVYVTGSASRNFPTTSGAYDTSYNGGSYYYSDVFVSKLNSGLTSLLASTYLGGYGDDGGNALTLDPSGNVYVTGYTDSMYFPTTSGAYDTSFNGGYYDTFNYDAFVSKLNSGLTSLLASTYLGGARRDVGNSLALDTSGNVYVTGYTGSPDFPTTSGAYDTSSNGSWEGFVSKLNSGLTSLLASTFLGGSNGDYGNSLALDTSGNVYVTGYTFSPAFPTTSGAYDTSLNGSYDVFVSKLDGGLTGLLASTFLGGSGDEYGWSLALDTSGNVYVTGATYSSDFPTTNGAYDTSLGGWEDVFVSKLDGNLSASPISLSFSEISSPQAVGVPFGVTITAKDTNGNVSLWSNAGAVSPASIYLNNGQWTGNITLYESGSGVHLGASGEVRSGTSNDFAVIGQGSGLGKLTGDVWDNVGGKLSGANVYLEKNETVSQPQGDYYENQNQRSVSAKYPAITDNQGKYHFTNIPSGNYSLWADFGNTLSDQFKVFIPEDKTCFKDIITITLKTDEVHNPVILVPGIMGSKSKGFIYPGLPAESPADANDLQLHDPLGQVGWSLLSIALRLKGYRDNNTIIPCPYDWRRPLDEAVEKYLIPRIDDAKLRTGKGKVDIIAHSMGGLLVRAYIQGDKYQGRNDINKFAMVGTPNQGAALAYYMWEGGDPYSVDTFPWLYAETTEKLLNTGLTVTGLNGDEYRKLMTPIIWGFYHNHVKSIRQLLPTEAFLLKNGSSTLQKISTPDNINRFLEELNSDSDRTRMGTDTSKIETGVFSGTGQKTRDQIVVQSPNSLYQDGVPERNQVITGDGDGTVATSSATWPCKDGFASCKGTANAEHATLVRIFADELVTFLKPALFEQGNFANADNNQETTTTSALMVKNILSVSLKGRVQPYIVDPTGKGSGIHPKSGDGVNTIKKATVSIGVDAGSISIENPVNGTYKVYLKGVYQEDYGLNIGYMDEKNNKFFDYSAFNHAATTSFTFTLNSTSPEKIVVHHIPLPPINLQADAVDSGGLKTKLTWEAGAKVGVVSYNVYSKEVDEPYLKHMGNTKMKYFETGHPWAENASIKTRVYAVSAIKDDGTESFLSTMAKNNDRDHDGLSDEKEVSLGTDVNNPDTDGDKLKDGEEYIYGTNPLKADTDEDLYNDYGEIRAGSDPLAKDSIPSILGSVTDTKGNHLESVRLKLKGKNTRVSISGVSDAQGFFGFANLEEDTYSITATKVGYKKITLKITLKTGEVKDVRIKMRKIK